MQKLCLNCNTTYETSTGFYKDRTKKDGLTSTCKLCITKYRRKYNRTLKAKQSFKKSKINHKDKHLEAQKRWLENNPHKRLSEGKFQRFFRKLKHKKPSCVFCGNNKTEAHHEDYTRPYSVLWCCSSCHKLIHAKVLCVNKDKIIDYSQFLAGK